MVSDYPPRMLDNQAKVNVRGGARSVKKPPMNADEKNAPYWKVRRDG
jgi:hypothetical protein